MSLDLWLIPSFFIVAFLYAAVGHGGASGYLALFSLFSVVPEEMRVSALLLNCMVSGIAFLMFYRAGHFSWHLTWPFLLASVPFAWLGGMTHLSSSVYKDLLSATLFFAAFRLSLNIKSQGTPSLRKIPLFAALPLGGAIGLVSGIVGVGGGVFLSPILLFKKWASPKAVSASSALFILVNSLSALLGRFSIGHFRLETSLPFVLSAFAGGLLGAHLGANHFSGVTLRRILSAVLIIAALKLVVL